MTDQQLDNVAWGLVVIADLGNPHLRRLASKLLKAGLYIDHPQRMDDVSLSIQAAREKEAMAIIERLDAGTITRDEIRNRILADPEIEHINKKLVDGSL